MTRKMERTQYRQLALAALLVSLCQAGEAQEPPGARPSTPSGGAVTLFQNVRIFDGKSTTLSGPRHVLVRGNKIERISTTPIPTDRSATTTLIDGGGRTLMPGLIDAHWHAMLIRVTPAQSFGDVGYNNLVAGAEATDTLMRGFTTVRDLGGPVFGLKTRHRRGRPARPAHLSVRRRHHGHERAWGFPPAHRSAADDRRHASRMEQLGGAMVADSPDEVRVRTREQLMQGASQIKLTAGGGVSSPFSPVDVTTFTEAELRAAVEAAENWGTYVATHAFTPAAIQRSIAAGVKVIEHGMLMDEATAKLMAEKGIWLSMQPIPEALVKGFPVGTVQREKAEEVWLGIPKTYELAKKYKLKTAWGTDVLFSRALAQQQGAILASMAQWFTPAETLIMATSTNAELLALSGKRNPYPGKLGVVEEGALADLLLVDGDPIANIKLIEDPEKNLLVIMKDGRIYKNALRK